MPEDEYDIKTYAIYFVFVAILTILVIRLAKSQSDAQTVIFAAVLLISLFIFAKVVVGTGTPKTPKAEKTKNDDLSTESLPLPALQL